MTALDAGIGLGPRGIVGFLAVDAGDDRRILHALGADIQHRRTALLQTRVDRDGSAHHNAFHLVRRYLGLANGCDPRVGWLLRRRWDLDDGNLTGGGVKRDQVGEGSAGIDSYTKRDASRE